MKMKFIAKNQNKIYIWIPYGEIQIGRFSRSLVAWYKGRIVLRVRVGQDS